MPKLEAAIGSGESFSGKFIRPETIIFTSENEDLSTQHTAIAETEGVKDIMDQLANSADSLADGGLIDYSPYKQRVTLAGSSSGFRVPKSTEARKLTAQLIKTHHPTIKEVVIEPDFTIYKNR